MTFEEMNDTCGMLRSALEVANSRLDFVGRAAIDAVGRVVTLVDDVDEINDRISALEQQVVLQTAAINTILTLLQQVLEEVRRPRQAVWG